MLTDHLGPTPHHHSDSGRCGIPNTDLLFRKDAIPSLCIKIRLIDDASDAVRERGDNSIGSPGHPPRIGRTPKHIIIMKIERELAGHMMSNDCTVNVQRPLRFSGSATREVQQCWIIRRCRTDNEVSTRLIHQSSKVNRIRYATQFNIRIIIHQQHIPKLRQTRSQVGNLLLIETGCCDQNTAPTQSDTGMDRLRSECRKERTHNAPFLESPQYRYIELRDPTGQYEYPLPRSHPESLQYIREPTALFR